KKLPGSAVDIDGRLRLEAPEPGEWMLVLGPPASSGAEARFDLSLELGPGENRVPVELRVGSVRGHCASASDEFTISFRAGHEGPIGCQVGVRPDVAGRFELPTVLAGSGRIGRDRIMPEGGTIGPIAEVEVEVPAGGSVEVEVP